MEFLEKTTIQIIRICNEIYPKLNCGYFTSEEEQQLEKTLETLHNLSQQNLNLIYPDRNTGNISTLDVFTHLPWAKKLEGRKKC